MSFDLKNKTKFSGSIIGHQQDWMEEKQPEMWLQGDQVQEKANRLERFVKWNTQKKSFTILIPGQILDFF